MFENIQRIESPSGSQNLSHAASTVTAKQDKSKCSKFARSIAPIVAVNSSSNTSKPRAAKHVLQNSVPTIENTNTQTHSHTIPWHIPIGSAEPPRNNLNDNSMNINTNCHDNDNESKRESPKKQKYYHRTKHKMKNLPLKNLDSESFDTNLNSGDNENENANTNTNDIDNSTGVIKLEKSISNLEFCNLNYDTTANSDNHGNIILIKKASQTDRNVPIDRYHSHLRENDHHSNSNNDNENESTITRTGIVIDLGDLCVDGMTGMTTNNEHNQHNIYNRDCGKGGKRGKYTVTIINEKEAKIAVKTAVDLVEIARLEMTRNDTEAKMGIKVEIEIEIQIQVVIILLSIIVAMSMALYLML